MQSKPYSILILDDDDHVLKSLARLLRSEDHEISCHNDVREALNQCSFRSFDLILSDQRMPRISGTEFFENIAHLYPKTRRVLISGYSDFSSVTDAFNAGIIHKFVVKPWDNKQLKELIAEQLGLTRRDGAADLDLPSQTQGWAPRREDKDKSFYGILTSDPAMSQLLATIRKTASSEASFFIHGETGSGKELIAQAIHGESERRKKAFIAINCANLTEPLLESQLFGHKKGAFTGADKDQRGLLVEAEGGTLFLDEVTSISIGLQAKLLRVLQEREYTPVGETKAKAFDVKVISASSLSLEKTVEMGKFREDLRYRLEVIPIKLPPLRARGGDKKMLFDHFLTDQLARHGHAGIEVDQEVYDCVDQYSWPGNVRELANVCTYIAALTGHGDEHISLGNLPPSIRSSKLAPIELQQAEHAPALLSPPVNLKSLEQAISDYSGHRDSIAKHFGISRMTLWRRMKKYGLA
jgi:DNA-binding NtrC family response regulator